MSERSERAKKRMNIMVTSLIGVGVVALGALAVVMHT